MSVEWVLEGVYLVRFGEKEVEKSNNGSFKFSSLVSSNGNRWETLPQNVFTDVSCNKEWDSTSKSISLLKEFIKKDDDNSGKEELEDNDEGIECS